MLSAFIVDCEMAYFDEFLNLSAGWVKKGYTFGMQWNKKYVPDIRNWKVDL